MPFCVPCVGTDWFGTAHFDVEHPNSSNSEQELGWRAHVVVKSNFFQPPLQCPNYSDGSAASLGRFDS